MFKITTDSCDSFRFCSLFDVLLRITRWNFQRSKSTKRISFHIMRNTVHRVYQRSQARCIKSKKQFLCTQYMFENGELRYRRQCRHLLYIKITINNKQSRLFPEHVYKTAFSRAYLVYMDIHKKGNTVGITQMFPTQSAES